MNPSTSVAGTPLPAPFALAFAALALALNAVPASAKDPPAPLRALQSQGVTIVGTFPAPGGLTAWAGYAGRQPLAFYATPDGRHVIVGSLLDSQGQDVTEAPLAKAVQGPMTAGVWQQLERSHWITDGKANAPRTVYVFTDPNCPYCNKFWADARPWVDSGKVQLRHIMVGILTPTSAGKAAALLSSRNPADALATYERGHVADNAKVLGAGPPRPLGDAGLKPLVSIPPKIQAQLDTNEKLMASLRLQATPAFAWRDAAGAVQSRTGAPPAALAQILGPR